MPHYDPMWTQSLPWPACCPCTLKPLSFESRGCDGCNYSLKVVSCLFIAQCTPSIPLNNLAASHARLVASLEDPQNDEHEANMGMHPLSRRKGQSPTAAGCATGRPMSRLGSGGTASSPVRRRREVCDFLAGAGVSLAACNGVAAVARPTHTWHAPHCWMTTVSLALRPA